jgi:hypothetical protein
MSSEDQFCIVTLDGLSFPVSLEANITEESYKSHTKAREFVPLTVNEGMRNRIDAQFFITGANSAMTREIRQARFGDAQAWFYQEDKILLLWRCNLLDLFKDQSPVEDHNLHVLWVRFEQFLLQSFPQATLVLTPSWNRPYDQKLWEQFIHLRGFTRQSPAGIPGAAFVKDVVASA